MSEETEDRGDLILYSADDGAVSIQLRVADGRVWLSQVEIAELFQTTPQNVNQHISTIIADAELSEGATSKDYLLVRMEGGREVRRSIRHFSLEMILAIGYRVRSQRGTQFRQWATTRLKDYLVKGFVLDEKRLRDPGPFDYFDELLAKIRDIRASEKRFYQKARDLYATATDYDKTSDRAKTFFATVQNKLLYAVTQHTAAELVVARMNAAAPNAGLSTWQGSQVRKGDVTTAKNFLGEAEIDELNRLVSLFLDTGELRARNRKAMTMVDWEGEVDRLLAFTEKPLLRNAGGVSHARMEAIAHQRFDTFDASRRAAELAQAEAEHEEELTKIVDEAARAKGKKK
ncbi:MAG: virulence RhuM family protein [Beijerinckiaceae bacterium]